MQQVIKKTFLIALCIIFLPRLTFAARIYTTGFELNTVTNGVEVTNNNFCVTTAGAIVTSPVRTGNYSFDTLSQSASDQCTTYQFSSGSGVIYARTYIYIPSATGYPSGNDSFFETGTSAAGYGGAYMNSSGKVGVVFGSTPSYGTTLSTALSKDTWHLIEIKVDDTVLNSQTVSVKVDGSLIDTQTGSVTAAANSQNLLVWGIGLNETLSGRMYFDDMAVNDSTGANQNSYPGSGKVIRLTPNAAGDKNTFSTQTGGTAGATNNFTRVDETTPDGATTFNGSPTLNEEDLYKLNASGIGASDTVNVVQVDFWYRGSLSTSVATAKLEIEKTSAGTILQGSAVTPNSTTFKRNANSAPRTSTLITYLDPDGSAWTQATLDTMQIGMKITTGNTNRVDVSTLWAYVDYTPAAAPVTTTSVPMCVIMSGVTWMSGGGIY